jgi:hypothetical protein
MSHDVLPAASEVRRTFKGIANVSCRPKSNAKNAACRLAPVLGMDCRSNDKTPGRYQRRALSAALDLEPERHQDVGVRARDRELVASRRPRNNSIPAADQKFHRAGFEPAADGSQFITHVGFRPSGLAVGQVLDTAYVSDEFHAVHRFPTPAP